ncbi:hypothetical protein [Bacteroides gallinaceum]|uniref:hypothetical protein n=1 Tax=Bacteroides gallinaceum TaxID=1462571 RepID=UPI0025AB3EE0|nr:hypothetical protein [Bacteroides gallinaceum]MDN0067522.1 hypothetical protein [Bacteroides gallinaceum]
MERVGQGIDWETDIDGQCTIHQFVLACPFGQWMVKWTDLNLKYDHPNGMKHPIPKPGLYDTSWR